MPYRWTPSETHQNSGQLTLWPYQSLQPIGFVIFIGATFALLTVPLMAVLGTIVFWWLLPFLMLALWGVWFAIKASQKKAQVLEVLTLSPARAHLIRHNPKGPAQEWDCNVYWARAALHPDKGPVPNYVTLMGEGREVEIGAFLSEDERLDLFKDLQRHLAEARS